MAYVPNHRPPRPVGKPKLLAITMALVLLASIFTAWLVIAGPQAAVRRGEQIVAEIRQQGLVAYWGDEPIRLAYMIADRNGHDIGRMVELRERQQEEAGGGYIGRVEVLHAEGRNRETWWISDGADAGTYTGEGNIGGFSQTNIFLKGGEVTVQSGRQMVRAPAPGNYLPEGLTDLAARLVARNGERATFTMILDIVPFQAGEIRFMDLVMEPVSSSKVRIRIPAAGTGRIVKLDASGKVVRIESLVDGTTYRLIDSALNDGGFEEEKEAPSGRAGTSAEPSA